MGAEVQRTDTDIMLDFYRGGRALGFGERPGKFDENELRTAYNKIYEWVENIETEKSYIKYKTMAHVMAYLRVLEFEVASQLILTRFPSTVLKGKTKKEMYTLFLRCAPKMPELVLAREERQNCLERLVETGLFRAEWFGIQNRNPKKIVHLSEYKKQQKRSMRQEYSTHQSIQ